MLTMNKMIRKMETTRHIFLIFIILSTLFLLGKCSGTKDKREQ